MKRKLSSSVLLLSVMTFQAFAAPQTGGGANEVLNDTVKPLFVPVTIIAFLVMVYFNWGNIVGQNKNFQAFFTNMLYFIGGVIAVRLVINWLATLSI